MAVWITGIATVGGALIANNASQNAAQAGVDAANQGAAANRNALAQQSQLTRQQLELQRPLIQTRDAALNQLNEFFGLPTTTPSDVSGAPGRGTNGSQLVALNGITTTGQHSARKGSSFADSLTPLNNLNPMQGIGNVLGTPDGAAPDQSPQLFYDPGSNAIVDSAGNLVSNVPADGVIPGLVHGFNNQVRIDAQGNVYSVGSKGENKLGFSLRPQAASPAAGAAGTAPRAANDFSNILNLPIFNFQRREGEGVINRNLAQRGKFFSGERGAGLLRFNNALVANRISEDFVQPRLTLAGYGQAAGNNAQNALAGQSSNVGQAGVNSALLASDRGNARASGYAGTANAVTGALGNLLTLREMNAGTTGAKTPNRATTGYQYYGARTPYGVY